MDPLATLPAPTIVAGENGVTHGHTGSGTLTLLDPEGVMFKRCAIKKACTPDAHQINWLVVRLNGVLVYMNGTDVVVTTRELYP